MFHAIVVCFAILSLMLVFYFLEDDKLRKVFSVFAVVLGVLGVALSVSQNVVSVDIQETSYEVSSVKTVARADQYVWEVKVSGFTETVDIPVVPGSVVDSELDGLSLVRTVETSFYRFPSWVSSHEDPVKVTYKLAAPRAVMDHWLNGDQG